MIRKPLILLTAGLTLLVAAGGVFFGLLWRSFADRPSTAGARPVLTVEAAYPGASAKVVADTVAAPIEQEVNGVEGLLHLASRCAGDGSYTLTATFKPGTDLNIAQVLVQNRVSIAQAVLPAEVNRAGISVKKKSPGVLLLLTLSSPDNSRNTLYLGSCANGLLKDELVRVPGLGDVNCIGLHKVQARCWIDPEKLAAHDLTAADVVGALKALKMAVQAGPPGDKVPEIRILPKERDRLPDPEQFEKIVLKTTPQGRVVYLKDVARVELGVDDSQGYAHLNGKPVVVLALSPLPQARPRQMRAAVSDLLSRLLPKLPGGVRVEMAFDFTPNLEAPDRPETPEYLLIDPTLPAGASPQRALRMLTRCEALLRKVEGVQNVLTLSDHPFDGARNRACLLVRLAPREKGRPGREEVAQAVRTELHTVEGMTTRLRDLSMPGRFPRCGYPIDLAIHGPEPDRVAEWAEKLAEKLGRSGKLTDAWANPESRPQRRLHVDIDHARAKAMDVSMEDVLSTLQTYLGSVPVNDFNRFGRTWQVTIQAQAAHGKQIEDIQRLKVRNGKGDMVPLETLLTLRDVTGPAVIDRLDGRPMVEIAANPAPGVSPAEARSLCETLADEVRKELRLPAGYRLNWLQD
jgi:multidrug efflux pump subunit AcrB